MVHASLESSYWPAGNTVVRGSTVGSVLRAVAARVPDRIALIAGDRRWSYAGLLAEATDGARALLASFAPGDVVAVWAENCAEWVALEFAAGLAGLMLVPVNPSARAEEVSYVLAHSGARGIFFGTDDPASSRSGLLRSVAHRLPALRFVISLGEWDALRALGSLEDGPCSPGGTPPGTPLPEVDPGSLAQILYTAGTTGRPKAVLLTHQGLTNNARIAARALGGRDGDVVVSPLPLSHVTGCGLATLGIAALAGTHVLMPRSDAALALELAERHRAGLLYADPVTLAAMVTEPTLGSSALGESAQCSRDLGSLRAVISGGAPLPPDLALQTETALGVPAVGGLFQTEAGCVITAVSPEDPLADRLGGVGRPLLGTEVKITGLDTGETLPCGTVGEIRVRGCQVMRGYLDEPRLTAEALDGDGWLRTGDLGSMDSRGYCRVVGRVNELIVRGGQDIYPREIEAVLRAHPAVAEAAVVGVPDRFWGGSVAAVVRLSRPLEEPGLVLTEYCGDGRLPSYKIPVRWLFVDGFPRTSRGEVRKAALAARLADGGEPDWFADLPGIRIPPQEPRSRALEDIGF